MRGRIRDAFIERHDDIRPQPTLDFDHLFGREIMIGTIDMRLKPDAVIGDFGLAVMGKHLIPAGIGQERFRPGCECMDSSHSLDHIDAGPEIEMVGIDKKYLRPDGLKVVARECLDHPLCPDRHEKRRLDGSMRRGQPSAPGGAVGMKQFEFEAIGVAHVSPFIE